jgi:hypothetical protein
MCQNRDSHLTREHLEYMRKVQQEWFQQVMGKMRALGVDVTPNMGVRTDGKTFE